MVIILGVAGLVWWSKSVDSGTLNSGSGTSSSSEIIASGAGMLSAEETFYNFGKISMKDGNVSKTFKVWNKSSGDVNLESVTTSCMCTVAYVVNAGGKQGPFGMPGHGSVPKVNEVIKAGESRDIEVVYDPNAHGPAGVGMIDRFVYLVDENGQKLELEIKANVTP